MPTGVPEILRGQTMSATVRSFVGLSAFLLAFAMTFGADDPLPRTKLAKLGKAATALVEVKPAYGSGFCVHPSGLFVTNEHVVRTAGGNPVSLILNAGSKTQKVLKAKVVRQDKDLDLALLRVEGETTLPTLPLGSDEDLTELEEVVACGFPFGTALTLSRGGVPGHQRQRGQRHRPAARQGQGPVAHPVGRGPQPGQLGRPGARPPG
jgi:S1-C subfamily serine protease